MIVSSFFKFTFSFILVIYFCLSAEEAVKNPSPKIADTTKHETSPAVKDTKASAQITQPVKEGPTPVPSQATPVTAKQAVPQQANQPAIKQNVTQTLVQQAAPAAAKQEKTVNNTISAEVKKVEKKLPAKTEIPGGVFSGTLIKANSPYRLNGSVLIPADQTVIVEPGVVVLVGGEYSTITVFGQILARGTKEEPITFRSDRENPNPWDWDRILFRSQSRSFLENCMVQHSNYGLYAVNTSLTLLNCSLRKNSILGLYVKNSAITIQNSIFEKGHIAAMMLDEGAKVDADQVTINENMNGIVCGNSALLEMKNSAIEKNELGVAVKKGAKVSLTDTRITLNKTGILSDTLLPKKSTKEVFDNTVDLAVGSAEQIEKIFKKPSEVSALTFAKEEQKKQETGEFSPGFLSQRSPREAFVQIVGNATVGMKYYQPTNDVDTIKQNRYIEGLQPEMQLFMTGRKYGWDVNFLMDGYRNDWLSGTNPGGLRANLLNLRINSDDHDITVGDFFQNGTEISVSNRKVYGIKYDGQFAEMGRGEKRMKLTLLGGETERSLTVGDHNPDIPNDVIADGFAMRQQMMGMGRLNAIVFPGLTVGLQAIHSRDLQNSIIRKNVDAGTKTSNDPLQGNSGGIDAEYRFYKGLMVARAEVDVGMADSLDSGFNPKARPSDFSYKNAIAGSMGYGAELGKYILDVQATTVRPSYYTGGNPYLTQDQNQGKISVSSQFNEQASAGLDYDLTMRNASYTLDANQSTSPIQNRATLNGKYSFGAKRPELTGNYTMFFEAYQKRGQADLHKTVSVPTTMEVDTTKTPPDTTYGGYIDRDSSYTVMGDYNTRMLKNMGGIDVKQPLTMLKSSYVKIGYRIQLDKDLTNYLDSTVNGYRDALQHTVNGMLATRFINRINNRFSAKYKIKTEEKSNREVTGYEINEAVDIDIKPRKLKLMLEGKYRNDNDAEDTESGGRSITQSSMRSAHAELKYTLSSRLSSSISGDYEKAYDETEGSMDNYHVFFGGLSLTYVF